MQPGELVRVNAYPQDQGSRVARVEVRLRNVSEDGAPLQLIDQKTVFDSTTSPCIFVIDSALLVPGDAYQIVATAFDHAGNAQDATLGIVVADGPAPPVVVLPEDPTEPVVRGIALSVTPGLVGPTTQSLAYYLDGGPAPLGTVFLPPYQIAVRTRDLAVGSHTLRAVATDAAGATAEDTLVFEVGANPSVPTVSFGGAVDGVPYVRGSRFTTFVGASDPFGIGSVAVYLDSISGAPIAVTTGPVVVDTTGLPPGEHRLIVVATNALGTATDPLSPSSDLVFRVLDAPLAGSPPAAPILDGASVPSQASDAASSTTVLTGRSVPGARVDLVNTTLGTVGTTVFADATGGFRAVLDARSGDVIEVVAYDYEQSTAPGTTATTTVPFPPTLVAIELAPASQAFDAIGRFADLAAIARFDDGSTLDVTGEASFATSDVRVASVAPGGRVVATGKGNAFVTALYRGVTGQAGVVVDFVSLDALEVTPTQILFGDLAATTQLSVVGRFSNGTAGLPGVPLTFTSSDPAVVSVSATGLVRPLRNGRANVYVSAPGVAPAGVALTVDAPDPPPVATIVSPASGAGVERGDVIAVQVSASDLGGGVRAIELIASGAAPFAETRTIAPPQASASATFLVPVPPDAALNAPITLLATAIDTNDALSVAARRDLVVVDETPPVATITSPQPDTAFNFGETIAVEVAFSDAHGVSSVRVDALGAFTASQTVAVAPPRATGTATVPIEVPFGLTVPEVVLTATARDVAGNAGASALVPIEITGADITPPSTRATQVLGVAGALASVEFEVLEGLEDLDHVELFFRRDGHGTFNRYTDEAGGNPRGEFPPTAGAFGTIDFDATRMGGDGVYEFATVGVDRAGNREALPTDAGGAVAGDAGGLATIATGTPRTTITTDVELAAGSNDDQDVVIDGARVTLVGAHRWRNVELRNGAVLTHRETTDTAEYRIDLEAWTLTIDATSAIDVTARGYLGGTAGLPGATVGQALGSAVRDGGSHGGLGGDDGSTAAGPVPVYGDLTEPLTLGSGGGGPSNGTSRAGDGGGLVLLGAINLVVDGAIRADGGLPTGTSQIGMGAGGGVNLRLRTVSGLGTIEADGGTTNGSNHAGGGGGRVAIRYLDRTTYDPGLVSARGGDGFYADGADGTVFLLEEGETNGTLVINGNGPGSPETDLLIPPGAVFESLILQNGANVVARGALSLAGELSLRSGARLRHAPGDEACLVVTASAVEIDATSAIDVSGRGYAGGSAGLSGSGLAPDSGSGPRDGGSHGGIGGDDTSTAAGPGLVYGDPRRPTRLGGGGGGPSSGTSIAGAGGGCVRIVAASRVDVDGSILANGGLPTGTSQIGMGAGGSIWITTSRIGGAGEIRADGGTTNGGNHAAGGGGRVSIEYDFVDPLADLAGLRNVTARGGDGFYADGAPGTVFLLRSDQMDGVFVADAGRASGTWAAESTLPEIGPGTATAITADTLSGDGGRVFVPDGLVGLRLNPDLDQAETFAVASNTADTITVVTPNENGVAFASVASPGARYAADWRFDEVVLRGGVTQRFADPVTVAGAVTIGERSVLTHPPTTRTPSYEPALDLAAGAVTIAADSRIDVSARGYLGGTAGVAGDTIGNLPAAAGVRDGGSHGGRGGDDTSVAGSPAPTHGDARDPQDLGDGGSGPSSGISRGGSGGGRVFLVADDLVVEGSIRADGGLPTGTSQIGMGAGGTLNLVVGRLDGAGTIEADGGTTNGGNHAGGGGGRVAIRVAEAMTLPESNLSAHAGDGFYGDGGHGSIYLLRPGQTFGDYILDGGGFVNAEDSSEIPVGVPFDDVILRNGVRVVGGGLLVDGSLRLESNAVLTHAAGDEGCLQVAARALVIDATSAIDVTGRGYPGGASGGQPGTTLGDLAGSAIRDGGSFGGRGGDDTSTTGEPGPVYGDPRQPRELGSGGGAASSGTSRAGAGGGCVRVVASESVRVDGAIRADGGLPSGTAQIGMGSGGSVWVTTGLLAGEGTIEADGGTTNGANHAGGGGGRVALYYDELDPLSDLGGLRRVTALGGDGFYADGAPGTIYAERTGVAGGMLIGDAGRATGTWPAEATLTEIGPGVTAAVDADTLTGDGGRRWLPGGLVGLRINPDLAQAETFAIVTNDASTLTVATPNENGVAFASVASAGARYAGQWRFESVVLRGGVTQQVADPITIDGALALTERSVLTHPFSTAAPVYEPDLDVRAGSITIGADSGVDVSARGYLGGTGGLSGFGEGYVASGGGLRDGGSHGGLGGDDLSVAGEPASTYGDPTSPRTLGAGGNGPTSGSSRAGSGGGRVRLVATGDLTVDGVVRADGGLPTGTSQIGMGAGGSVELRADRLLGTGSVEADGGTTNGATHAGGGGGRIAIHATTLNALPTAGLSAAGGDGFYADGEPGTIVVDAP
ncbi:MAG: hypothetical protein KC616_18775 [Myxococcales bacterium]|nr:hypothetical protein [Myxococcales bacterium]